MQLTADQSNALDAIGCWLKDDDQWMFYLGGFAGTGKTTLMHHFINSLSEQPVCLAPTGKAASVLQKRLTNAVVTTIHSALYKPQIPDITKLERLMEELREKPNTEELKEAIRLEKERLAKIKLRFHDNPNVEIAEGELVIVDEASMVNNKMFDDLSKLKAKVLFVGDPGQLPPVGDSGYFTYTRPDSMLKEVMRQALDNPIVKLSMWVRNGDSIPKYFDEGAAIKRPKADYDITELVQFDQLMCGTNVMRRKLNRIIRKLHGREAVMPEQGEKLICLKNQYKFGTWLINGVQCVSASAAETTTDLEWAVDVMYEGDLLSGLPYYHYPFQAHYNSNAEQDPWPMRKHLAELDYAYAVTVHKSQGSEWNSVALVDDEMFAQDKEFRKRWLYTAVTRAKEKLVWLTR